MSFVIVQFIGLVALVSCVGIGYARFIRPYGDKLSLQARGLLMLVMLTMMGGFIGSTGWWADAPQAFAWDLPALASRMLGAAAVGFGWLNVLALHHPTFGRVRLALWMLLIYLGPLAVAIVLFHLGRFDFSVPITYSFFILVIGMMVVGLWYVLRQPTIIPETQNTPPANLTARWLGLVAILMTMWGLALFITDSGPDVIWVWPGDLLTSRLIAAMLLAIAVGAVYSLRSSDLARVMLNVLIVYGVGVVIANIIQWLGDKPMKPVYVGIFGLMAVVSAALMWHKTV